MTIFLDFEEISMLIKIILKEIIFKNIKFKEILNKCTMKVIDNVLDQ